MDNTWSEKSSLRNKIILRETGFCHFDEVVDELVQNSCHKKKFYVIYVLLNILESAILTPKLIS